MSAENARKFEEALRGDEALRAKLEQAAASYAGDRSDERALFDAVVAPLAEESGLAHTFDDIVEAKDGMEIDEAELYAVAGGWGFCIGVGVSNRPEAKCDSPGYACAYVGTGLFGS